MTHEIRSIGKGVAVTGALLIGSHLLLWQRPIPLAGRYAIGVGALNIGLTVIAQDTPLKAWHAWFLSGISGGMVVGLHAWRASTGQQTAAIQRSVRAGRLAERAERAAHGLPIE